MLCLIYFWKFKYWIAHICCKWFLLRGKVDCDTKSETHLYSTIFPEFVLNGSFYSNQEEQYIVAVAAATAITAQSYICITGPVCGWHQPVTDKASQCRVVFVPLQSPDKNFRVMAPWLNPHPLTHLPLHKMAEILADDIFNCIFLNENDRIPIQISLRYVPRSPIDNKSALVQVMAWRRTGEKPLPEPMMTQFIDAYMRH